jgi:hypothetical protein
VLAPSQGVITQGTEKRTGKGDQLEITITILGTMSFSFQLSGVCLVTSVKVMGMVIPVVFQRQ